MTSIKDFEALRKTMPETLQERDVMLPVSRKTIFLVGASHKTATLAMRERLYIPEEHLKIVLPEIKKRFDCEELVVLSTLQPL